MNVLEYRFTAQDPSFVSGHHAVMGAGPEVPVTCKNDCLRVKGRTTRALLRTGPLICISRPDDHKVSTRKESDDSPLMIHAIE